MGVYGEGSHGSILRGMFTVFLENHGLNGVKQRFIPPLYIVKCAAWEGTDSDVHAKQLGECQANMRLALLPSPVLCLSLIHI